MKYDVIGQAYTRTRRPDLRWTGAILDALALTPGSRIADVGAGTGNYARELAIRGLHVVAIEPSSVMRSQRAAHPAVDWIAAVAEYIPVIHGSVDAALCVLAVHHFLDFGAAMSELDRIVGAGPVVLLTFDPRLSVPFWLEAYFPSVWYESFTVFPPIEGVLTTLQVRTGRETVLKPLPVPWDIHDFMAAAGWRRPEIYLDADARAGMSAFALSDQREIEHGVAVLKRDLESGEWQRANASILGQDTLDVGYRLVIARKS